jgi:hypothetical protein
MENRHLIPSLIIGKAITLRYRRLPFIRHDGAIVVGQWLLWIDESRECHFVRWMKAQFGIGTDSHIGQ